MIIGSSITANMQHRRGKGGNSQTYPFVSNFKSSNMAAWITARNRAKAGTGRGKLVFVGDSTTLGVGGPSGADLQANCRNFGMPAQLVPLLSAGGIPVNYNISLGSQFGNSDTRLTINTGWSAGVISAGGNAIKATAASTPSTWSMAPFDSVTMVSYGLATTGAYGLVVDGNSTTINTSGAPNKAFHFDTLTPGLASHTLAVNWLSGGEVDVLGPICWNSAVPAVDVFNLGVGSSATPDWDNATNNLALHFVNQLGGDCFVVNLGINDLVNGPLAATGATSYDTNMRAIVTALKALGGSVILCVPTPCNNSIFIAGIAAYKAVLQQISIDFDVPLVSWFDWLGGVYTASKYYGGNNSLHPNFATYGQEAVIMQTLLQSF